MTPKRLTRSIVRFLILALVLTGLYWLITHHWPSSGWWLGLVIGWIMADAHGEIVGLLERQNALLERMLAIMVDDRQDYQEPIGRR